MILVSVSSLIAIVTSSESAIGTINLVLMVFMVIIIFSTCFSVVISWIHINFFYVSLENVSVRRHLNIKRNINVIRNVVDNWYFHSNVVKSRNLECSIVTLSLCVDITNRIIIFDWSCSENRFRILIVYFQSFGGHLGLNSILFVDVGSRDIFFLDSCTFIEFCGKNFGSVFNVFFLTILDVKFCSLSVNDRLEY